MTTAAKTPAKAPAKAAAKTPIKVAAKAPAKATPKTTTIVSSTESAIKPIASAPTAKLPTAAITTPTVASAIDPILGNELRKKELFDLVVDRSGMKKKDVKPIVEAMLAVLGDAFAEQREMDLQPLGKLKIQRSKELADGQMTILKLRQKTARMNAAIDTGLSNPIDPEL